MKMQTFYIVLMLYTVNCYTIGKQVVMDGGKIEEYRTTTVSTPETNKTQEKRYTIGKQIVYPGGQIIGFRNPNIIPLPVTPQVKMNIQKSSPTTTEKKVCLMVKTSTKPGSNNVDIQVTQTPCNNGRNKRYSIGNQYANYGGKIGNFKKRSDENIDKRYSIGNQYANYGGKIGNFRKRSDENIEKRWQYLPSQSSYGGGKILNFKKRNQVAGPGMKIINFKRDVWDDLGNDPRLQSLPGETIRKGNKIINW